MSLLWKFVKLILLILNSINLRDVAGFVWTIAENYFEGSN